MNLLETTSDEILENLRRQWRQQVDRGRALRPIRSIDALLADLEELHLAGRKRVPDAYAQRLCELNRILPAELRREMRSRITIVHLMDWLYEVQDVLLQRKAGADGSEDDEATDLGGPDRGGGDPEGYLPRAS